LVELVVMEKRTRTGSAPTSSNGVAALLDLVFGADEVVVCEQFEQVREDVDVAVAVDLLGGRF
jgi:hypothetical protein